MAKITATQNTADQNQDPIVISTSATARLKRAVDATGLTPTGSDYPAAAQMIGTHVDDAAFTAATDPIVAIAGLADDTSPDSVNEGDIGAVRMSLSRALHTIEVADAAAVTAVASVTSSTTLLAANANRLGATIVNDDANDLYVKFGATASTTSYTVKLVEGAYYELPHPVYRGIIDGIWAGDGSGSARITELT